MHYYTIETDDILAGRYRVENQVGLGSFGAVFGAIDQQSGERVAIKALPPQGRAINETTVARFQREMKIISALVHRNIIGLYDFGQTERGVFFMVLEYVDGDSLEAVLKRGPIAATRVISVCEQIGSALLLAHHRGIIHRDLKPANIMLVDQRRDYLVKVLDFGTAKLLNKIDDEPVDQLTREGMAVGTPRYIAPEQARGEQVGPWSDLYALGLLMYEMLTGARAVKADDIEGAVSAHISPRPLVLEEIEQVPQLFRPILGRLLEKNPRRRYQSADVLLADLDAVRYELVNAAAGGRAKLDPVRAQITHGGGPQNRAATPAGPDGARRPDISEFSAEAQKRARAREILQQPQQPEPLELDWDQDEPRRPVGPEQQARAKKRGPQRPEGVLFRLPQRLGEWVEAAFAPLVALVGFILIGAQLVGLGYPTRMGLSLTATGLALAWSLFSGRKSWRYSFFRLWILFSLAAGLIAHALGPRKLITELLRGSTWFLNPVMGLPGMERLAALLTSAMRWYAVLLSTGIEWIVNFFTS